MENLLAGCCGGGGGEASPDVSTVINNRSVAGQGNGATPLFGTPVNKQLGMNRLLDGVVAEQGGQVTSTPNRSLFGVNNNSMANGTPGREARPSPERLDAQIRQLSHCQENVMKQIAEQNQALVDTSRSMLAELKEIKTEMSDIRREMKTRDDASLDLLRKIAEKPVPAAAAPAAAPPPANNTNNNNGGMPSDAVIGLTEEEKLLLESFGLSTQSGPTAAGGGSNYNQMYPFLQQQQMMMSMMAAQQQAAAAAAAAAANQYATHRPIMGGGVPPTGYGSPMGGAPLYSAQSGLAACNLQSKDLFSGSSMQLPSMPTAMNGGGSDMVSPMMAGGGAVNAALSTQQKDSIFAAAAAAGGAIGASPVGVATGASPRPLMPSKPLETGPPTNVVISRSDRIPSSAPPLVSMSVTVPPQHRLGGSTTNSPSSNLAAMSSPRHAGQHQQVAAAVVTPKVGGQPNQPPTTPMSAYRTPSGNGPSPAHNYYIHLPEGLSPITTSPFKLADSPAVAITTQSLLSNIPTPVYSAVTPSPEKGILNNSSKTRMASGSRTTPKTRQQSVGESGAPEDYEPEVEFEPVVPLPEEIEVVTGEEDEDVLWEERAKLFRFADETREWKERGLGQARILKNRESGKVRFLMRREQTFKICANHSVYPGLRLDAMKGNAKARIWGAQDYSDGEVKTEKFCIRLKTEELAERFQAVFEEAARNATVGGSSPQKGGGGGETTPAAANTTTTTGKTLADFAAAQKSGSWECGACLTRNDNAKIQCLACEGAKPGCEEEVKKLKESKQTSTPVMTIGAGGGFKFGGATGVGTPFGGSPASATTASPFGGTGSSSAVQKITFGTGSAATTPAKPFAWGGGAGSTTAATTAAASSGFTFGSSIASTTTTTLTTSVNGSTAGAGAATATASSSFGGFTFSTTPTVAKVEPPKAVEEEEKKKAEEVKPSPFSGFSFGGAAAAASSSSADPTKAASYSFGSKVESVSAVDSSSTKDAADDTSASSLFSSLVGTGEGFKADPNFKGFSGAGAPVFGSGAKKGATAAAAAGGGGGEEAGADVEYEPDVQFQPVIPLPELVEVKTGEEEEDVLFSERCKLFRYVAETKEWKERGIGDFKVLRNRDSGRVRFLMRREQVLKICCNHFLTPDIVFSPLQTSDRAWNWTAPDFSEGEVVNELFALKLKTAEMAGKWKAVVDEAVEVLKKSPPKSSSSEKNGVADSGTSVEEVKDLEAEKREEGGKKSGGTLADFAAAQKSGSWECGACLTRNDNAKIQCLACEGPKPGCEEEVEKLKAAAKPAAPVMSIGAGGGFKFGTPATGSDTLSSGFVFGSSGSTPATNTSFGGGFSFQKKEESPFGSGGAAGGQTGFSFGGVKVSPRKHNVSTNSENELYQEDEEADNVYFEPVIALPDKVDVVTGEEDEEALFSHRAKLFRFTDGEWKERGLGDIKVLRHRTNHKVRLLMRREQVLKICLNHFATAQLVSQFKEKDPKSWLWGAPDFSDGELADMTFVLRFKTPEISAEFKAALDSAVGDSVPTSDSPAVVPTTDTSTKTTAVSAKATTTTAAAKPSSGTDDDENLFPVAEFKPADSVGAGEEKELSFEGQGLKLNSAEDAKDVAAKISSTENMHILTLAGNTIGIEAAGAIGEALKTHPEFRRAHWKDMFTGRMKTEIPPALINLSRGIMTAQARLVELDLSDNAFGPIGMEGIVTLLRSPSCFTLQELRLNNTGCGVTGGKLLAKTLLECYHRSKSAGHPLALKVFVLGRSRQENEGGKALAEVLKLMGSLEEVVMPQNGIYYEGLTALADAFSNNPNLRILNMNDNTFTEKGARAMGRAIKQLNNLEVLNLGDCLLKSAGAKLICRAIRNRHPNLRELVLDSNEIRIAGGLEIAEAVADKSRLERLSVDGNQFGEKGAKTFEARVKAVGKFDVLGSMEDNEEPDEDEADPEPEDDDGENEEEAAAAAVTESKPAAAASSSAINTFSFASPSVQPKSAASIFGGTPKAGGSLFGGATSSGTSSGLFGGSSSSVVFGKPSEGQSIFTKSQPLFGSLNSSNSTPPPPPTTTAEPPLATGASIFSTPKSSTGSSIGVKNLFGKPSDDESAAVPDSSTSIFGSGTKTGGGASDFSFSSLASNSEQAGFGFGKNGEGFTFKGAGSAVFGAKSPLKNEGNEDDKDGEGEDDHDPHFEPIVPLPELVEVKTGEEDEEVIFKHRAKVYRYNSDTKEWKERGVGDIKILRHPQRETYRVLLRRDQVYKIACNHLINKDMELMPLASSETAWCWYAMDFSEGCAGGSVEHLAVRFKTKDTAVEFKQKFENCQKNISQKSSSTPVTQATPATPVTQATPTAPVTQATPTAPSTPVAGADSTVKEAFREARAEAGGDYDEDDEDDDEDDEDYEDDDENYQDNAPMFEQVATLSVRKGDGTWDNVGKVQLRIMYDDEVFGARVIAEALQGEEEEEEPAVYCNHLIAMQTRLEDDLTWSANDYSTSEEEPSYRTFRAEFDSQEAINEFRDMFVEGKDLAEQSEIWEAPGGREIDPTNFYYGVGGDE